MKTMTGASNNLDIGEDIKAVRNKSSFNKHETYTQKQSKRNCSYCGKQCIKGKCPAYGKKCDNCGKQNHFASQCRQKMKPRGKRSDVRQFNTLSTDESDSEYEIMAVETDDVNVNMIQNKIFARMLLIDENKEVKFQLDSGVTANLIPRSYLIHSQIESGNDKLTMYNQSTMKSYGTCMLRVKNPKTHKRYKVKFIVVDDKYTPLLGAKAIQAMNLIKIQFQNIMVCDSQNATGISSMESIISEYSDVFEGEGTFKGALKLEIDESIPPVKSPLRRIPIALKPKLKTELQRLEKLGVIKPVDTPTDWVSSLVIVKKPSGKIRLCIDPKPLNKALKRCHYPLPIIEDLLPELSKAKVYSSVMLKMVLACTDGQKCHLEFRLPPNISNNFGKEIENLPGVRTVADDIIIYGEGQTIENATLDHDRKLKALLDRCRERNIKINRDKFVLRATEMPYIGHLLTAEGVKPDPEKIAAIVNMEKPTNVKGVQRLLGMINYLTKFLENLSDICEPIRKLTHKRKTLGTGLLNTTKHLK
ncbi:unnamed protein product [Mytilus coruscus]|uniref:CCHC-type domain-containing protein n=1 Tax=Mytilus coruscus TaxID=42192 RepID=A0A6J8B5W9_MYTCO|nr:unnamed protein product [Mytilus coruscus]